ncbi:MAG: hypothetical protein Q9191_003017 [Dirinaria sp. TL-2023a]
MMATTPFKAVESTTRLPLMPNTNESRSDPPTPFATAKSRQSDFLLRHKQSIQTFQTHLDSSESIPSAHESIYEASIVSSQSKENIPPPNEQNNNAAAGREHHPPSKPAASGFNAEEERRGIERLAWLNYIDPIHRPHRLDPITEKTSLATLQTKASSIFGGRRAVTAKGSQATITPKEKASTLHLRHTPSANALKPLPTVRPRHRKSFSLPSFSSFTRRSVQSSSSSVPAGTTTFPNQPGLAPPERKPTPPGLPTFNTPAAYNYRLPAPPARFRDHFRSRRLVDQEYRRQTTALPRGVVMRGENGELIRGRWRAGPSGHGVVGGMHPWYAIRGEDTTEMMRYPGSDTNERVQLGQPGAAAAQRAEAHHGAVQSGGNPPKKSKAWWEKVAWLCCGMERDEEGEIRMPRIRRRKAATEPLFVGGTNTDVAG